MLTQVFIQIAGRSESPCVFVPSVLIQHAEVETVQYRGKKEKKQGLTNMFSLLAKINVQYKQVRRAVQSCLCVL